MPKTKKTVPKIKRNCCKSSCPLCCGKEKILIITASILLGLFVYFQFLSTPPQKTVVFKGKLPCADCSGIESTLTIYPGGTYLRQDLYLGKAVKPFVEFGKWSTRNGAENDPRALVYQFKAQGSQVAQNYLLFSQDQLKPLDDKLKLIDAPFDLSLKRQ